MDDHDHHGASVAAWTGVIILIVAFFLMCLAFIVESHAMFYGGVALIPVGVLVGKALAKAGYGVDGKATTPTHASGKGHAA